MTSEDTGDGAVLRGRAELLAAAAGVHEGTTGGTPRQRLEAALVKLGILVRTIEHEALYTVAQSERIEREIEGGHTKNLFLKDTKGALFLVIAQAHTAVDLKALSRRLGAGRFSFGKADLLEQMLGVTPGSVTAFAVMNDPAGLVSVVVDRRLVDYDSVNCHPLENTATTNIARDDLLRFIRATGHEPRIESLEGDQD